jgi:hypothetical protein
MQDLPQHVDDIKAIVRECTGTPTEKLIALLRACGVTSTMELAHIIGLSDRAIRRAKSRPPRPPKRPYIKKPIPAKIRWAVFERDDFRCRVCGERKGLTCDHVVAESLGGELAIHNLQTLCGPCNSSKGAR